MADKKKKLSETDLKTYNVSDDALTKLLQRRMRQNEEMGLESSPEDTQIMYGINDPEFADDDTKGYVKTDRPKEIVLNPSLDKDEDSKKFTLAHELQHVNQRTSNSNRDHENDELVWEDQPGRQKHEKSRVLRSLMHPYYKRERLYNAGFNDEPVKQSGERPIDFDMQTVIKYAKEQGVPIDDIIDAMTMNYAIQSDKNASEAHNQTIQNQKQGRGFLGKLGLEKPMSTEDVYKPWKDMRQKRRKSK